MLIVFKKKNPELNEGLCYFLVVNTIKIITCPIYQNDFDNQFNFSNINNKL